jgi:DNA-binding response OmpR family regulator
MTQRPRATAGSSGTVLVVDRDRSLRLLARRQLEAAGYRVLDAGDAADAERIATLYVGPIHVLVVDADPAASALCERLQTLHPEMAVVRASERPRSELVKRGRLDARTPFVRKPFAGSRLPAKVGHLLARPR